MYDLDEGDLKYDDVPIKKIRLDTLRRKISYVPQDVFLFSDTIRNNIAFGQENLENEGYTGSGTTGQHCRRDRAIAAGLRNHGGRAGVTLSGGQKQRISIARALVKNPQIVVFDDCLSAVDSKTEKAIINSIGIITCRTKQP